MTDKSEYTDIDFNTKAMEYLNDILVEADETPAGSVLPKLYASMVAVSLLGYDLDSMYKEAKKASERLLELVLETEETDG
jgi:hypothetical protein